MGILFRAYYKENKRKRRSFVSNSKTYFKIIRNINEKSNGKLKVELVVGHRPIVVGHLTLSTILRKLYKKTRSKQHFERRCT